MSECVCVLTETKEKIIQVTMTFVLAYLCMFLILSKKHYYSSKNVRKH